MIYRVQCQGKILLTLSHIQLIYSGNVLAKIEIISINESITNIVATGEIAHQCFHKSCSADASNYFEGRKRL